MKVISAWSFCILVISFLTSCNTQQPAEGETDTEKEAIVSLIDCNELKAVLEKDKTIQLVDVRTPEEYEGGTIAHATNIDFYGDKFAENFAAMDKEKPLYIFCAKGGRSAEGATKCKELGFKKVYDLKGGYNDCQ